MIKRKNYFDLPAIKLYTNPAKTAPTIGASQNNHNCEIAHPPTNIAGPVLLAGLTDVLVTGILIK